MKKMLKSTLGIAAAVALTGAAIAPAALAVWGDNSGRTGGRQTYSIKQINSGALGNKIVLNSIVTSDAELTAENIKRGDVVPAYDERDFVGARVDDGTAGKAARVTGDTIAVEEGKTYIVQMYVHNNNPNGTKAVAKDVTAQFSFQNTVSTPWDGDIKTSFTVSGKVSSSNAQPTEYWDSIDFVSNDCRSFYLDYVEGSALLENNGIGKNGGVKLGDALVARVKDGNATNGVKIGYDKLDGNVPGCYQYDNFITIKVKPVFMDKSIQKKVRLPGSKDWQENLTGIKIGDTVEYQITYTNLNNTNGGNVSLIDELPDNMAYVSGTTKLYNSNHKPADGGLTLKDTLTTTGVSIGDYAPGANAIVRFQAKLVDKSLKCGKNVVINWAKAIPDDPRYAVVDSAAVTYEKTCKEPEPEDPCKVNPNDPKCKPKDPCEVNPNDPQCKPKDPCEENPDAPECKKDPCEENPNAPECKKDPCEENPDAPECKKDPCEENPNAPECKEPEPEPEDYCEVHPDDAKCKKQPEIITVVTEMPSTGPVAAAGTALGAGTVVTAAGYLISSRKQLRK